MPEETNCWNRNVVHVDHRLHSPVYDAEGKKGRPWWIEATDQHSMCFFAVCEYNSYNAWIDATDAYFNNEFIPHYEDILSVVEGHYGGAAMPQDYSDLFNKLAAFINEWLAFDKTHRSFKDMFFHSNPQYWESKTRVVVNFFDEAACNVDLLDEITIDMGRKHKAKGVPKRSLQPVEGGFLGNPAGTETSSKGMSGVGMAVGLVAIGAAGYFGFKALTE
jgi:hypothetical protein